MEFDRLAVIGIGLIGGSFALCAKERGLVHRVIGVARSEDTLKAALERGAADEVTNDPAQAAASADLVYIAAPVGATGPIMQTIAPALRPDTLVTDAGSTKTSVMALAREHLRGRGVFIGGHPMAGSEESGPRFASGDLFHNKTYILTTAPDTPSAHLARLRHLISRTGANVIVCDADQHDRIVARTSHLPHLAASAICNLLADLAPRTGDMSLFSGNGLRDTTRVAAGPADVWRDILLDNRANVLPAVEMLVRTLQQFAATMQDEDADELTRLLSRGALFRRGLDKE